jgi:hypothetical protein
MYSLPQVRCIQDADMAWQIFSDAMPQLREECGKPPGSFGAAPSTAKAAPRLAIDKTATKVAAVKPINGNAPFSKLFNPDKKVKWFYLTEDDNPMVRACLVALQIACVLFV